MPTLYLDLISGVSGDMFLGALLDLGVRLPDIERALAGLKIGGYHLHAGSDQRNGITGTRFEVHLESDHEHGRHAAAANETVGEHGASDHAGHGHDHLRDHGHAHPHEPAAHHHEPARTFAAIRELIGASSLSPWVRERAVRVFERIAAAEGKIHGLPPAEVHFHEVGAVDSIVDIVGACVALECLGCPRVLASPVCEGTGWVECAHGRFPVPAPATLEILGARGIAVSQCDEPHELVTPTGAALLAEFVKYRAALLVYWLNIALLGATLYFSWVCALGAGLVKPDLPAEIQVAIKRRIVIGQSLYAFGALLCLFRILTGASGPSFWCNSTMR